MKPLVLAGALLVAPALARGADPLAETLDSLAAARRAWDDDAVEKAQKTLLELAPEHEEDYRTQRALAESYLFRATLLRTERTIVELDSRTVKEYRARQKEWGVAGLTHALKALLHASTDAEKAQAERLVGELYVHQIDGMIAGMVNGPKALEHVRKALELAPDDPEVNRAQGLMFLYNPPINGGDVEKAVSTFRRCSEQVPESDEYQVYLALAFRKKGKPIRAELAAKKALHLNPKNPHAPRLLEVLAKDKKEVES